MRRQFSEAGKSRPTLGAQAHLPCGVLAPGESQGPTTSAGGPSARRPSQRSPRAPCPWPQDGAVVQGTRGPAGHLQDREPGPTRSGRSREGDPQIPESGCGRLPVPSCSRPHRGGWTPRNRDSARAPRQQVPLEPSGFSLPLSRAPPRQRAGPSPLPSHVTRHFSPVPI